MPPIDRGQAHERLGEILSRDEYQGYVSPIGAIVNAIDWLSRTFASLDAWVQWLVIGVLVAMLAAIATHVVFTMIRAMGPAGPGGGEVEGEGRATVAGLAGHAKILAEAKRALSEGRRAEAVRLFYLAAIARMRERGRIPASTALTGRELRAAARPRPAGMPAATVAFERCVYGGTDPADGEVEAARRLHEEVS